MTRPSSFDRSFSLELFIGPLLSIGCRISLPGVLRHHSYIGILSAVSPVVPLECILPKVSVRHIGNFAVFVVCSFYYFYNALWIE